MKQKENIYTSDEGCLIVRKTDGYIMGNSIDLGSEDTIENYEEKQFTEKEIADFNERYGIINSKEKKGKK